MSIVPTPASDRARFWAKVDKNGPVPEHRPELGPCWLWTAACFANGYGAFRLGSKQRRAHVVSFEWHVGPANGLKVCHACDVKPCVRPDHLFRGTHADNMADMVAKGRQATGLRNGTHVHGHTTLTEEQVREIVAMAEGGAYQQEIADAMGINQTMVSHILRGTRWGHLGLVERTAVGKPRPSPETIRAIRVMAAEGVSYDDVGRAHGYSKSTVWRIVNGLAYRHVT